MSIRGDCGNGKCNYMLSVRIYFKRNDISNLEVKGCKHWLQRSLNYDNNFRQRLPEQKLLKVKTREFYIMRGQWTRNPY